ncbi:hypothetical protein HYN59_16370 [Flavobacterium album]|uniref:Uncharacterized protein n=1 Tax=Flavobacterium album TaxID=2175091 RepID=A0A2S1R1R8_9FLAO|nr:hypothetical protein [Flavobacterium album]AWH86585.1 hypothetical protein HYN59_16370 [Flavobacterium album]
MDAKNCLIKIPGSRDIALPQNGIALLTALDSALDENTFLVLDNADVGTISPAGEFSTYILFEIDGSDTRDITEKIREIISYGCSPEIIEASQNYQVVAIDYCMYSFK